MDILLIIIFIIGLAILMALFLIWKKLSGSFEKETKTDSFVMLQNQINEIIKTMDNKMGESRRETAQAIATQFGESQKLIRNVLESNKDITSQVSQVKESTSQVFGLAQQLQNLEKVLKNQKQRGSLGEAGLELVLSNILPPDAYSLQYSFEGGDIVDAVVKTKEGLIPVDAKFSLDNYNRLINEEDGIRKSELEKEFKNDLKKRIDETSKYIKPKQGTLPFAFMFIPAEGIYYDLLVNEVGAVKVNTRSLIDYAHRDKNVIIVSPTTFAAFLQSVLYGFRAFKIEESATQIRKDVESLSRHFKSYNEYMNKLGNNLKTVINSYSLAYKELGKTGKDFKRITQLESGVEPLAIDKPTMEE